MILRALLALLILTAGFVLQELVPRPPAPAVPPAPPRTLYDGYATPASILRAHAIVESGEADWAIGDDGISRGRMQIHEGYHAERAADFGEYDPANCYDALRVASGIWQANARYFERVAPRGDPDTWADRRLELTIGAYQRGRAGVVRLGPVWDYVERVRRAMR